MKFKPILVVALSLAGCASMPEMPDGPPGAPPMALFISPMGEPFRAPMFAPYPSRQWFDGADADHDGALTRAEFLADAGRFFDLLDQTHAGRLSSADIDRYEKVLAPEITREPPGMPPGGMPPGGGPPPGHGGGMPGGGRNMPGGMGGPGGGMGGGPGGGMGGRGGMGGMGGGMPGGGMGGGPPGGMAGGPPGGDAPPAAMLEIPRGAAIYALLPYAEPVASARRYFGEPITRELFLIIASQRFDALSVDGGPIRFSDLGQTMMQRMSPAGGVPPKGMHPPATMPPRSPPGGY